MEPELLNSIISLFLAEPLLLLALPWKIAIGFICLLLLLLCSALISGSEIAYFSLSPNDYEHLELDELSSSRKILLLIADPDKLLATILITNNFINIAIILLAEILVGHTISNTITLNWARYWQEKIAWLANSQAADIATVFHFSITVIGVTFLLVLFGEVTPKVYATVNSIRLARIMSTPLNFLTVFFSPLSHLLVNWSTRFEKILASKKASSARISKEDIGEAIDITVSREEDSEQDLGILKRIVKFSELSARQIMRSRVDVIAVDESDNYTEILELIRESGYSRYPVYENGADNVVGLLYSKDLITHLDEKEDYRWQQHIREDVLFVPASKKIDDLLRDFKTKRLHMAIIVDEYGGTSGIVTLEDVLEEVIGDIRDEFDENPEIIYKKIDNFNFIFDGKTLLNDVCRIVGIETDSFDDIKGESESIAGLLLEHLGQMPIEGYEEIYGKYTFKVRMVNKRRIEQILLTLPSGN